MKKLEILKLKIYQCSMRMTQEVKQEVNTVHVKQHCRNSG